MKGWPRNCVFSPKLSYWRKGRGAVAGSRGRWTMGWRPLCTRKKKAEGNEREKKKKLANTKWQKQGTGRMAAGINNKGGERKEKKKIKRLKIAFVKRTEI